MGACVVSSFPCLRIHVVYRIGSATHEALLHPDSIQAAGLYREVGGHLFKFTAPDTTRLDSTVELSRVGRCELAIRRP